MVDLATGTRTRLPVEDTEMGGVAWSPDGTQIAFTQAMPPERMRRDLWITNADGTDRRLVVAADENESLEQIAWSPAGEHIAVMANRQNPDPETSGEFLVIIDSEGSMVMEQYLFGPTYTTTSLAWSADGRKLLMGLFWYPFDGANSIAVFDLATRELDVIGSGMQPHWSPSGGQIVFVHFEEEGSDAPVATAVMNEDGTGLEEYSFLAGTWSDTDRVGWGPQWSPDGTRIAYSILRRWGAHIETMDPDGRNRHAYDLGFTYIAKLLWQPSIPASGFIDVPDDHPFAQDVAWMYESGITTGCRHPYGRVFCPDQHVSRGELAAFFARAFQLTDGPSDPFVDDDSSIFEGDIEMLAAAGITRGCNPPLNDRYCPDASVTRGQAAALLVRALGLTDNGGADPFVDDDRSIFERDIEMLAAAGITRGCNPPDNDKYCPDDLVTRQQMAAFLHRALGD